MTSMYSAKTRVVPSVGTLFRVHSAVRSSCNAFWPSSFSDEYGGIRIWQILGVTFVDLNLEALFGCPGPSLLHQVGREVETRNLNALPRRGNSQLPRAACDIEEPSSWRDVEAIEEFERTP